MQYTRKGDDGMTKTFGCNQKISKSSAIAEALGNLDEVNSLLGVCKTDASKIDFNVGTQSFSDIIGDVQEGLFIIQAELAGANKKISKNKTKHLELLIDMIEKELPPIKSFLIPGGSEMSSLFDYTRTVARRTERRVVAVSEEGIVKVSEHTLAYLNRLSSLLYSLARFSNYLSGVKEIPPSYK